LIGDPFLIIHFLSFRGLIIPKKIPIQWNTDTIWSIFYIATGANEELSSEVLPCYNSVHRLFYVYCKAPQHPLIALFCMFQCQVCYPCYHIITPVTISLPLLPYHYPCYHIITPVTISLSLISSVFNCYHDILAEHRI
jgi:hypothetical protein